VLRRIFGPKLEVVAEGWRRLCMRSFIIFTLNHVSRKMMWAGHVARMGEMGTARRIVVWKPEIAFVKKLRIE
jgi:hypothetical protein